LKRVAAAAVHIFTGLGAIFGLLALLAAASGAWEQTFAWLGIALIIDGADGPLARAIQVEKVLPRFSGQDLDNAVDYLNYVAVPAFVVVRAGIVPEGFGTLAGSIIMLVSLYHFADKGSKTGDGYFVGFPAIWNIVVLYCLVLGLPRSGSLGLLAICAGLTFVPLYWVHPLRLRRLRPLTIGVISVWGVAAIACLAHGFPGAIWERAIFAGGAIYFVAIGVSGKNEGEEAARG
jgi:phosphatidylcholine synthase